MTLRTKRNEPCPKIKAQSQNSEADPALLRAAQKNNNNPLLSECIDNEIIVKKRKINSSFNNKDCKSLAHVKYAPFISVNKI